MKIFSIVGARPQFIKVAALHREIVKSNILKHSIIHTGQHYDDSLSSIFFKELEIPAPLYHLNIADNSFASIQNMQKEIEDVMVKSRPDMVIVYGDTNSTLAGALAANNLNIKLAHVEAGLRSFNILMPEEKNRIETDKMSDLLFCPTKESVENLKKENLNETGKKIFLSGDIMLDAFNYYTNKITREDIPDAFILCTLHRESLVQSPQKLTEVIKALNHINHNIRVILPAHPRLKKVIKNLEIKTKFLMKEPIGYLAMLALLKGCSMVITDSGGLQKEAFFSSKICVTIRNETEWTELVDAGVNFIAGDSSAEKIIAAFKKAGKAKGNFNERFYGNGNASAIIVSEIEKFSRTSL